MRVTDYPRIRLLLAVGALSVVLAGCASPASLEPAAVVTPSPSSTPARSATALGVGFIDGPAVNDGLGDYTQLALGPDSPLLQVTPALVDAGVTDLYPSEDIAAAQGVAARFAFSEGIDSTLMFNDAPEVKQAWFDAHAGEFTEQVRSDMEKEEDVSFVSGWGGWRGLSLYGGGSRFTSLSARLVSVTLAADGEGLAVHFSGVGELPAVNQDRTDTKVYTEKMTFDMTYGVTKQADRSWMISGWNNDFHSTHDAGE